MIQKHKFKWTKKAVITAQGTTRMVILNNGEIRKIKAETWDKMSKIGWNLKDYWFSPEFPEKCREAGLTDGEIQEFLERLLNGCPCNACRIKRCRARKSQK